MESAIHSFPMLLRPSGATLYQLRIEADKRPGAPAAAGQLAGKSKSDTEWQTDDRIAGLAVFAADHPGFQGHFPGTPILPGFLHIQLAMDIVQLCEPQAELAAILSAKFHQPILPGVEITIDILRQSQHQAIATLRTGDEPASRMEFQF